MALAARGAPNLFLTLTTRWRSDRTPAAEAKIQSEAWTKLRKRAVRKFGFKSPEFLAVFEATKRGWPHLHILVRSVFIPWKWLRDTWEELTGSPGVRIERIHSKRGAAAYIAKYIGKAPGKFGTSKRYWTSKNYDLDKDKRERAVADSAAKWEVQQGNLRPIAAAWQAAGFVLDWRSEFEVRAEHPT